MRFTTTTIIGTGRGKQLGFPTINMIIPDNFPLQVPQGVYASKVTVQEEIYTGALYYGPASTFGETDPRLEVYLIDSAGLYVGPSEKITIEVGRHIRDPKHFELPEQLVEQMTKDINSIRSMSL